MVLPYVYINCYFWDSMIKRYSHFLRFLPALFCFLLPSLSHAQRIFHLDKVDSEVILDKGWKFHDGDNKDWSSSAFDDRAWDTISLQNWEAKFNTGKFTGNCWFRLHLKVSPSLFHKTVLLLVRQQGASDIYLSNKLVQSFGKVGDINTEVPFDPGDGIYYMQLGEDTMQTMAVRFSANKVLKRNHIAIGFQIELADVALANKVVKQNAGAEIPSLVMFSIFFTISIFHLLLFLYYRKVKSNLYYSILAMLLAVFWLYPFFMYMSHDPLFHEFVNQANLYIYAPCFFLIVLLLYSIFDRKYNAFFWILLGLTILTEIGAYVGNRFFFTTMLTQAISSSISGIIMVIKAVRKKLPGAWIIASGFLVFLCLILGLLLYVAIVSTFTTKSHFDLSSDGGQILVVIWAFSIPTSMSIYLASDSARTNKRLALQITHVKQLSEQNIQKEKEKQGIIEGQKQVLEQKVKEATHEILEQKDELAEKNKEITDSINYARRIQTSILPEDDLMKSSLGEHMVIYRPKDVVSGDFYWCHTMGDKVIFAVADCTGHGVPGAFMSMIGNSLLNEIVIGKLVTEANTILDELRRKLVETLQQNAQHITTRDGMDIALCVWDRKDNVLQFAGANNSLYLVSWDIAVNGSIKETERVRLSNQHLLEILPDKQPIGYQEDKMDNPYTKSIIQLHKGDTIFIASDGYTDQFGGERNKKFTSKKFRELIASLVNRPISEQRQILEDTMDNWRKFESQTDDICVIGVRI
jgi:serine phosphatase RsbU (regulator of sigma subunit)